MTQRTANSVTHETDQLESLSFSVKTCWENLGFGPLFGSDGTPFALTPNVFFLERDYYRNEISFDERDATSWQCKGLVSESAPVVRFMERDLYRWIEETKRRRAAQRSMYTTL